MSTLSPARGTHKARRKPERRMAIHGDPFGGGLVRLTVGDDTTDYRTRMIPTATGPFGFEYAKEGTSEVYQLSCSSADPTTAVYACNCKGFTTQKRCKHVDALKAMLLQLDA